LKEQYSKGLCQQKLRSKKTGGKSSFFIEKLSNKGSEK